MTHHGAARGKFGELGGHVGERQLMVLWMQPQRIDASTLQTGERPQSSSIGRPFERALGDGARVMQRA